MKDYIDLGKAWTTDVWVAKDPGLGYKDYGHKDYCNIDALRYGVEFLGKWKGEQKNGNYF